MRKYESIMLIRTTVSEEKLKEVIEKFKSIIETDGKVENVENLGKRKLAYIIKKEEEAFYICYNFEANATAIKELERNYNITDEVLKFIIINKD